MNRITMMFFMLAVTSGCMAVDPDPIEDTMYTPPRRPLRQQPQSQAWSYTPQSTTLAKKNANDAASPAAATASKTSSPRSSDTKSENTIVKASYTQTKPAEEETPPVNLGMLRLTNSKRITFRYEIKDTAAVGAAGLEIWGTTDMHAWKKYDTTPRSPSSLTVEVKDEGLYGFTMISRGKDEPAGSQPPSSEPPQVWVAVDLSKPAVQLLGAEVTVLARKPSLVVRWTAKDRNFGSRPITLLYADHPEGPWRPLATNLENSGRYEGSLPLNLAASLYVRVQAADLMGNLGMAQSRALHLPDQSSASTARARSRAVSIVSVDGE